ncbi:MAG: hypothetical protein COB66_05160 [Coxiella sp. (in: Bacteria)]|nr:MAG: hypothetical protein COB66_05160 [Coxiella sp. (in: g-proteobacteria)]
MRSIVIQSAQGATKESPIYNQTCGFDADNSHIEAGSVFARFYKGKEIPNKKPSDDKIIIGYLSNGLPFQIIVDGSSHGKTNQTFRAIDQYIVPLVAKYSVALGTADHHKDCIRALIDEIFTLRENKFRACDFTMSMAIGYKKNEELKIAGFGIGDTGIILQRADDHEIIPLVQTSTVAGFKKDAFDDATSTLDRDTIIERNSYFDIAVKEGDEIFGYTYLTKGLLQETETYKSLEQTVLKQTLASIAIQNVEGNSLFNKVSTENQRLFELMKEGTVKESASRQFGDDCTLASVKIPGAQLQRKLSLLLSPKSPDTASEHDETLYNDAQNIISDFKNGTNIKTDQYGFLQAAEKLKSEKFDNKPSTELTRTMITVECATYFPENEDIRNQIKTTAHKASGKKSLLWKALGVTLMALGAALSVVGSLAFVGSLGSGVFAPGTVPSIALLGAGIGLFTIGGGMAGYGIKSPTLEREGLKIG